MRPLLSLLLLIQLPLLADEHIHGLKAYGNWYVFSQSGFEVSGHYLSYGKQLYISCLDTIGKEAEFGIDLWIDLDGSDPPPGWDAAAPVSVAYRFDSGERIIEDWKSESITKEGSLSVSTNDPDRFGYFLDRIGFADVLVYQISDKTNRLYLANGFGAKIEFKARCRGIAMNDETRERFFSRYAYRRKDLVEKFEDWLDAL